MPRAGLEEKVRLKESLKESLRVCTHTYARAHINYKCMPAVHCPQRLVPSTTSNVAFRMSPASVCDLKLFSPQPSVL